MSGFRGVEAVETGLNGSRIGSCCCGGRPAAGKALSNESAVRRLSSYWFGIRLAFRHSLTVNHSEALRLISLLRTRTLRPAGCCAEARRIASFGQMHCWSDWCSGQLPLSGDLEG